LKASNLFQKASVEIIIAILEQISKNDSKRDVIFLRTSAEGRLESSQAKKRKLKLEFDFQQ